LASDYAAVERLFALPRAGFDAMGTSIGNSYSV